LLVSNKFLRFNGHFPAGPGLAGTRMSPFGAKDDVGGGNNWSCKTCKAPVKMSRHQRPVFLQAACPSCRPTNSAEGLKVAEKFVQDIRIAFALGFISSVRAMSVPLTVEMNFFLTNFNFPYGTIWPICAESAVKPQPTNLFLHLWDLA